MASPSNRKAVDGNRSAVSSSVVDTTQSPIIFEKRTVEYPLELGDIFCGEFIKRHASFIVSSLFHLFLFTGLSYSLMPEGTGPPIVFLEAELSSSSEVEEIATQVVLDSLSEPTESESDLDLNMDEEGEEIDETIGDNETLDIEPDPQSGSQAEAGASASANETTSEDSIPSVANEEPKSNSPPTAAHSGEKENDVAEFFGTRVYGKSFVYVLDRSGSMSNQIGTRVSRLQAAKAELLQSIGNLDEDQYFYVILFSSNMLRMFDDQSLAPALMQATSENKRKLGRWLEDIGPSGGTQPSEAIDLAIRLKPNAIFMLSDGAFNDASKVEHSAITIVKNQQGRRIPVNTIAFQDQSASKNLSELSAASNGTFRFVDYNNPSVSLPQLAQMSSKNGITWELRYDLAVQTAIPLLTSEVPEQRESAHEALQQLSFEVYPDTASVDLGKIKTEQLVAIWKPIWRNAERAYRLGKKRSFSAGEIAKFTPDHWFHLFQAKAFESELPDLDTSQLPDASDPNLKILRAQLLLDYQRQHGTHMIIRGALLSCLKQLSPQPMRRKGSLLKTLDASTWDKRFEKILESREREAAGMCRKIYRMADPAEQEHWARRLVNEYPETKSAKQLRTELGN